MSVPEQTSAPSQTSGDLPGVRRAISAAGTRQLSLLSIAWLTVLLAVRQLVGWVHGQAHAMLAVPLEAWQHGFITVVIVWGPLAAAVGLWWRRSIAAVWAALAVVAAGSLFGVVFHFGPKNPDHVLVVPDAAGRTTFIASAVALVIVEAVYVAVSLRLIRRHGGGR